MFVRPYVTVLCLVGLLSLWGCPSRHVSLAAGMSYQLQPAGALRQELSAFHRIRGRWRGRSFVLTTSVEARPNQLVIAGISAIGRRLFLLIATQGAISYQPSPGYQIPIDPKTLLAVLQFTFWPVAAIQQGLRGASLQVRESPGKVRLLMRGKKIVIRIQYQQVSSQRQKIIFQHRENRDTLTIETYQPSQ